MDACRALLGVALLLLGTAPLLASDPVYKCRDADGALSYQDRPCPPGTDQPAPLILESPELPPPTAAEPAAPAPRKPDAAPVASAPPPPPPPTMYRCTDAVTKKTYVTANPPTAGRYVPYWTVAPAGMSSGGMSVDTPGTAQHAVPAYVYVEDRCRTMPVGELCGYWIQRFDEVRSAKRTAFNDTRPQLEQEEDGLRGDLATYCGR